MHNIPLNVLIIDNDNKPSELLNQSLQKKPLVLTSVVKNDFAAARELINSSIINTVFIDPLNFNLDAASEFVFSTRIKKPEIVFVLYMNRANAERISSEFYYGERKRFLRYYKLDKQTPVESFEDELNYVLDVVQQDLSWRMSQHNIVALQNEAKAILKTKETVTDSSKPGNAESDVLQRVKELLERFPAHKESNKVVSKSVFFSHRFAEELYVKGLSSYLGDMGFSVVTGNSANTYISKAIVQRIKECEFFLCLLTKDEEKKDGTFTTSPWLMEEKGVAIAFGKPLVLMVEEGVTAIGGLEGDWQRIHFVPKGFLVAAQEAVKQLKSYTGETGVTTPHLK